MSTRTRRPSASSDSTIDSSTCAKPDSRAIPEKAARALLGGGAKIRLVGPLRVRLDYRVFKLQGSPLYETYHRFYVGANLRF